MYKELVVSRYNEDVQWIKDVPKCVDRITVYNKGCQDLEIYDDRMIIVDIKNAGREAHTWVHHFLYRNDTLADITFLAQGNPFEHSPDYLERLEHEYVLHKSMTKWYKKDWPTRNVTKHDYAETYFRHEIRLGDIDYFGHNEPEVTKEWFNSAWNFLFTDKRPENYYYGYGAMWALPKETIKMKSMNFWVSLYEVLDKQKKVEAYEEVIDAWAMEALWNAVFSGYKTKW